MATTNVCMICASPSTSAPRVEFGPAMAGGTILILALIVGGARFMRNATRTADKEREAAEAKRRASDAAIKVGLIV